METLYLLVSLVQSFGVSFGVGASTIAIINFIVASRDGIFDDSEKRLMKVVYKVLRIGMVIIVLTLILQALLLVPYYGAAYFESPFLIFVWTLVVVLFGNAFLMTKHLMPMWLGPALQASTWYSIATLYFLGSANIIAFSFTSLLATYIGVIVVMTFLINSVMAYVKTRIA